jgi:hypothetical protein
LVTHWEVSFLKKRYAIVDKIRAMREGLVSLASNYDPRLSEATVKSSSVRVGYNVKAVADFSIGLPSAGYAELHVGDG